MTTELLIFGTALTLVSGINHAYMSSAEKPNTKKKVVAHIEYILGAGLLMLAVPVTLSAMSLGAFVVFAASAYVGLSWTAARVGHRYQHKLPNLRPTPHK